MSLALGAENRQIDRRRDTFPISASIGGDSDTIACITGGIAQAFYGKIPKYIIDNTNMRLDMGLKRIINLFNLKYNIEI